MSNARALISGSRRPLLALTVLAAVCLLRSPSAETAGPMPLFQAPTPCGQVWDISTYKKHWNGDQDALDMAQRDTDGGNISEGEPALAAAAGTVKKVATENGGEHRVFLDHGGGWETAYVHLESLPPLTVGQHVAQGEMVGRISNSGIDDAGTEDMHLHYNQERDGTLTRVSFNGQLVDTHAGDESSWGTYGDGDAEEITSHNCPGNSFVPFTQNGERYQLIYKPGYADRYGSGPAKIVRLDGDGKGVTTTWAGYLGQRYTNLVPFTLGANTYLFTHQASTGKVRYFRMNLDGDGLTSLAAGTWWKGWTHVTPFVLGGKAYFLVYDSLHGYANIDRVANDGSGSTKIYGSTWTKGWTHFVPYELGPRQYVLLYKGGSGEAKVIELSGGGSSVSVATVWSGTWSTGWTHLVPVKHHGSVRLFAYRSTTGEVSYGQLRANGQGSQHLGSATWNGMWTAITPFAQDGAGALLIYSSPTGTVETRKLNAAGTGSSSLWIDGWTKGWS
jgi:hypothetical protein